MVTCSGINLIDPGRPKFLPSPTRIAVILVCVVMAPTDVSQGEDTTTSKVAEISIGNNRVRASFRQAHGRIEQQFFVRDGDEWQLIAETFHPPDSFPQGGSKLYDYKLDPEHRFLVSDFVTELRRSPDNPRQVVLSGSTKSASIREIVTLIPEELCFHVEVQTDLTADPPELDYVILPLMFAVDGLPDFTHAPALKRTANDVIGDGVFHAPAAIVQKGSKYLAIVPDVDGINDSIVYARGARQHPDANAFAIPFDPEKVSLPAALDLELKSGLTERPLLAYGLSDFIIRPHVYWERDNSHGAMTRRLSKPTLRFAFNVFLGNDAERYRAYQHISAYHWRKNGSSRFKLPRPQAMPYAEYAKASYPAYFAYQGYEVQGRDSIVHRDDPARPELNSWQQWQENGEAMGGFRLTAPQWYDLIYNTSWWNNVSDATGLYYWGAKLDEPGWIDKAQRIINFTLSAPQDRGIFPSLFNIKERRWILSLWHPPAQDYDPHETIHIWDWQNEGAYMAASASTTAAFLLQYDETCENDSRILPYVERYAEFLIRNTKENGIVPSWYDKDLSVLPSMSEFNADGGIHILVLAELYKRQQDPRYIATAQKLAEFLIKEVLPKQRWSDFETFYSCAVKPEAYFDQHTGQPGRDLMSVGWAISGMCSLYEVTGDERYLDAAEAAADFAGLYQHVWSPHFIINCYPFGGLAAQLGDGEWVDQRGHRFAAPLIKTGLLTGRTDLVERGVAVSRASLSLMTHPRLQENDIYTHIAFPYGLGPENAIHEGYPQTPLASGPSWSTVGGLAAAARLSQDLGGAYIDFSRNIHVGVDGVRVVDASLENTRVKLSIQNMLSELRRPYREPYEIQLKVYGLSADQAYDLEINGKKLGQVTAEELADYPWKVEP